MNVQARERVEDALCRFGLYRPVRNAYHYVFNRGQVAERRALRMRLRPFVESDTLAFDVGANHGRVSEALLELGARVVAIEPNPSLARRIRRRYRVPVVAAAVAREAGEATLHVGRYDGHSTVSSHWKDSYPERWSGAITVPATTLDLLIKEYGTPSFVKVDTEGFEDEVVGGLSKAVRALSFEYQCRSIYIASKAIIRLMELGEYEFGIDSRGEFDGDRVIAELEGLAEREPTRYGDIYCMLTSAR